MTHAQQNTGLEMLLKARLHMENEALHNYASVDSRRAGLQESLRRVQDGVSVKKSILRENLTGRLETSSLRSHAIATIQTLREGDRVMLELLSVHRQLGDVQEKLTRAVTKRKSVESLHQKRVRCFQARQILAESSAGDELMMNVAWRNNTEEQRTCEQ